MYVYIYIYPFILFYLSIIITNIVDHQTCLKKCYTKLLFLFCLMLLLLICGYFGIGFSLGTLCLGCLGLDFCSASLPLCLSLCLSIQVFALTTIFGFVLDECDAVVIYIICALFPYLLCICFVSVYSYIHLSYALL